MFKKFKNLKPNNFFFKKLGFFQPWLALVARVAIGNWFLQSWGPAAVDLSVANCDARDTKVITNQNDVDHRSRWRLLLDNFPEWKI